MWLLLVNKGFVSTVFLLFLIQGFILVSILLSRIKTEIQLIDNMKEVHRQISYEDLLIKQVNCLLLNEETASVIEVAGMTVSLEWAEDSIEAILCTEFCSRVTMEIDGQNQRINDYLISNR